MAGEKHLVGPTGLVFGGPHLMGGQAGTGVGPGYTAELLLPPDAGIRGNAGGFHAVTEISAHDAVLYTPAIRRAFGPAQPHSTYRRVRGNPVPVLSQLFLTRPLSLCADPSLGSQCT